MLRIKDYLLIKAAARYLGVSDGTLRNWDQEGKIRCRRSPGGYRLYDRKDLEELLWSIEESCSSSKSSTEQSTP